MKCNNKVMFVSVSALGLDQSVKSNRMKNLCSLASPFCTGSSRLLGTSGSEKNSVSRKIVPNASIVGVDVSVEVEAPREYVFSKFSDFECMREWSGSLKSVERSESDPRKSKWTIAASGLSFSWDALDENIIDNEAICWKSLSGLEHTGRVYFTDSELSLQSSSEQKIPTTKVRMCLDYNLNQVFAALASNSMVGSVVDSVVTSELQKFRVYCLREYRKHKMNS
mmetsp:Transcript_145/g.255  ORF Transcript_145/g.255 Transcript_145/m.255 type:complete len:224 (-) Transcript_145:677-1348(-)